LKTCLNGATTMPYTLEEDTAAAHDAGFDGLEIWWDKLTNYLNNHSPAHLKDLLTTQKLHPVAICPLTIWPFRDTEQARQTFREAVEIAPQIGCDLLIVCPDFQPARLTRDEALRIHASELRDMARLASENGLKLAIEPIGGHTLVPGSAEALQLIEMAGEPTNVGILVDTFHYFRSGVSDEELAAIPLEKLFIIHVNDCEDGALNELTDAQRLYPTLGIIPLKQKLSILVDKGYDGYLSVEIFRPAYWDQPVEKTAHEAYTYLKKLMTML
jgi:2-keto-myo-inositol isomerase